MMGSASLNPTKENLKFGRRLTSDPNRSSLGLLPSGPDPVGEWLAHRQPPGLYIGGTAPDCKPPENRSNLRPDKGARQVSRRLCVLPFTPPGLPLRLR